MDAAVSTEKLRAEAKRLSGLVLDSLDQNLEWTEVARRAYSSRSKLFRLFRALADESPGAMRRRLLLERAAWQLGRTQLSVTEIALDASYGSLEAFTRAFRKAFRISPSLYRRMGVTHPFLPAPNAIHFHSPGPRSKGASDNMDLFDLFAGSDSWHTRYVLEQAKTLSAAQLDSPLHSTVKLLPWDQPDQTLRQILDRLVHTKEVWAAALTGGDMPPSERAASDCIPEALLTRFEKADAAFQRILCDVRNRGAWSDTFVDALCEPPETFTFGGMFAHVVTFNTYRRLAALSALRGFGVKVEGFGCPMEYETAVAPWRNGA